MESNWPAGGDVNVLGLYRSLLLLLQPGIVVEARLGREFGSDFLHPMLDLRVRFPGGSCRVVLQLAAQSVYNILLLHCLFYVGTRVFLHVSGDPLPAVPPS